MSEHEELIGGCCVCSDDQGFSNNALVYCDGKGCKVACHTACYGIVSIPEGDWYCRRCEAGQNQTSCRLCPMSEGAMKRTSDDGWAHVICALYIPEVSFGNDATMEPIILSKIPSTRYGQKCSICIKKGRSTSEAMQGACCACTMKNCSEVFHVTCAQQAGLLYEDVRKNNCQYPIYCQQHQPKFSKFIRQIPPFHYKSFEGKQIIKEKVNPSQLSDFLHRTNPSSSDKKFAMNDETSQNSSVRQVHNSSNNPLESIEQHPNQSMEDKSVSSNVNNEDRSSTVNIKIEENDVVRKSKISPLRKKRQHPVEGERRPVGRPPSKKKLSSPSIPPKSDRISVDFYPRRPLPTTTTSTTSQRTFPPETLEEFLEQEWESSSDFLLQQTLPHDVSSFLSCLYQFKSENAALQKQFEELKHRRDSLRVTNSNLRRKLSEISTLNDSSRLPTKSTKLASSSEIDYFSRSSSYNLPHSYPMIKNERLPSNNGISLELLSQILTTSGPQLFAPTWNISNFGYANFPGANSISVSDESLLRTTHPSYEQ